uniref:SLH domain-containing protein n=1 Tax=Noccaea caerulescens TaxID=107243 RepID=A0A1J3JKH5_NOCCA
MCTFSIRKSPNSSFIFPKSAPLLVRHHRLTLPLLVPSLKPPRFRVVASLSGTSWVSQASKDRYGGWALIEDDPPLPHWKSKKKWRNVVITGVGSSLAVLFATVAYFSISKKGFRFSNPLRYISVDSDQNEKEESEPTTSLITDEKLSASEANTESVDYVSDTVDTTTASTVKAHRVTAPVSVDAAQQEAVAVLKKLKIIEDDVVADELCTRREYARWLVRSNMLFERNPKHRIVPAVALAGSSIPAFDDVNTKDPDFEYIQALAEAGITPSKLCGEDSRNPETNNFYAESFVSRLDLVNWKAQLECDLHPEIMEEVSRTKVDYIDTKSINPDMALGFFLDFLTGDKSTIRNVFGRIKRFQPNRPVTKAQAAVALTRGKMAKAISAELSRLEAESFLQKAEMEEIRSELLEKGEIRQFWDELLRVERSRGVEMEELRLSRVSELEEEKMAQEKWFAERLKEKAAIDCQKQLLNSLREDIEEMSQRLATDKSVYLVEQSELQEMLSDVQAKLESLLDKRSVLEAEVEALRILRSWVEDEAKASQARAKVLEEAGRRWRWNDYA